MKKLLALFLMCASLCVPAAAETEYVAVYEAELSTLNCLKNNSTATMALGYNIIDGLVEFDRFGCLVPSLATDWTVSEDGCVYTMNLRRGVKWYTHEAEEYAEVTAHDFVTGARWVLTKKNSSMIANTIYNNVVGAKDYYTGKTSDFSTVGVKALDDYTVQYTLMKPLPYGLKLFSFPAFYPANSAFIEECGDEFGTSHDTLLYCGAYIMTQYEPEYERVLEKNENYWNKDAITIDTMIYKYNKEASANGPELFLRGEVMDLVLPGSILDEWMNDPEKKKLIHPHILTNMSYFMAFNFEPKYEEEYAPRDWVTAVNNLNFRKSFFHGLDRVAALMTTSPYDYKTRMLNTFTRKGLVQFGGVDYTMMGRLADYTQGDSFDPKKALEYKAKAVEELKGRVTFPIQVVMPYNTGKVDMVSRAQVIEQQMEDLLGKDYIDIVLVPYAASGYNAASRNSGKFSFAELGWGPDFVDPLSAFDPLMKSAIGEKWGRIHLAKDYLLPDGRGRFEAMADEANAEVKNLKKRYELFAEAEAFLLDNAFVIPMSTSGGGFTASYLDPFSGMTGQFGNNALRKLKGAVLLKKPMDMETFEAARQKYEKERDEARKASKYN
ncbi:MAG: peptide ABC transporter substrate-binding protein [Pyramidobacter sp.]|nr:peptide ABC transporter substrate-binding protein [Pyramidobacter sp.]